MKLGNGMVTGAPFNLTDNKMRIKNDLMDFLICSLDWLHPDKMAFLSLLDQG